MSKRAITQNTQTEVDPTWTTYNWVSNLLASWGEHG